MGPLRFLNLAHGGFLIVGGYVAWVAAHSLGLPLYAAIVVAAGAGVALGLTTYFILLRPLLGVGSPRWDIAHDHGQRRSGDRHRSIDPSRLRTGGSRCCRAGDWRWFRDRYHGDSLQRGCFSGVTAIAILFATNWFLTNSRNGIALRAVAEDVNAAYLMGIPSGRIFAAAVAISGALATAAGALLGSFLLVAADRRSRPRC